MRAPFGEPQALVLNSPIGGLVDTYKPDLLRDEDASDLLNCHFDRRGWSRRRGLYQIGDQITTHPIARWGYQFRVTAWPTTVEQLLVVRDAGSGTTARLYKKSAAVGGVWLGAISGANPATSADAFGKIGALGTHVQHLDRIYYAPWDVAAGAKYYTGSAFANWGYQGTQPPAGTLVAPGAGTPLYMTMGKQYHFVYLYRNPTTGEESLPSPDSNVYLMDNRQRVTATIPINAGWDAAYTEVKVYRSFGYDTGSPKEFYELTITGFNGAVGATVLLSIADGDLGGEVPNDNAGPPAMDAIIAFAERIVGFKGTSIYYSKESNPSSFPVVNEVYIERQGGDPIAGIFVLLGQLYAVKRGSGVFVLIPSVSDTGDFVLSAQKITGDYGCIGHHTIVALGNEVYWLDQKGAVRFDGTNITNISDEKIRVLYRTLAAGSTFSASVGATDDQPDKQYVRWLIPHPSYSSVRFHLVYDVSLGAWLVERYGTDATTHSHGLWQSVTWPFRSTDGRRWVYTADNQGYVFRLRTNESDAEVWSDNGGDSQFLWRSKFFGNGIDFTLPLYCDCEFERSTTGKTTGDFTVSLFQDADVASHTQTHALFDTATVLTKKTRTNWPSKVVRRFALQISHTGQNADLNFVQLRVIYQIAGERSIGV